MLDTSLRLCLSLSLLLSFFIPFPFLPGPHLRHFPSSVCLLFSSAHSLSSALPSLSLVSAPFRTFLRPSPPSVAFPSWVPGFSPRLSSCVPTWLFPLRPLLPLSVSFCVPPPPLYCFSFPPSFPFSQGHSLLNASRGVMCRLFPLHFLMSSLPCHIPGPCTTSIGILFVDSPLFGSPLSAATPLRTLVFVLPLQPFWCLPLPPRIAAPSPSSSYFLGIWLCLCNPPASVLDAFLLLHPMPRVQGYRLLCLFLFLSALLLLCSHLGRWSAFPPPWVFSFSICSALCWGIPPPLSLRFTLCLPFSVPAFLRCCFHFLPFWLLSSICVSFSFSLHRRGPSERWRPVLASLLGSPFHSLCVFLAPFLLFRIYSVSSFKWSSGVSPLFAACFASSSWLALVPPLSSRQSFFSFSPRSSPVLFPFWLAAARSAPLVGFPISLLLPFFAWLARFLFSGVCLVSPDFWSSPVAPSPCALSPQRFLLVFLGPAGLFPPLSPWAVPRLPLCLPYQLLISPLARCSSSSVAHWLLFALALPVFRPPAVPASLFWSLPASAGLAGGSGSLAVCTALRSSRCGPGSCRPVPISVVLVCRFHYSRVFCVLSLVSSRARSQPSLRAACELSLACIGVPLGGRGSASPLATFAPPATY